MPIDRVWGKLCDLIIAGMFSRILPIWGYNFIKIVKKISQTNMKGLNIILHELLGLNQ